MILIVVFSYNRAMQLDFLLKSIFSKFKSPEFKIAVIYHTSGDHYKGYAKLKIKYQLFENITFLERKKHLMGVKSYLPSLYKIKNFKRFISQSRVFNKRSDNFKYLLERLLKYTDCEFTMFNTDDGFFFGNVIIPQKILDVIKSDPQNMSYRLYVGENLDDFPKYVKKDNNDFYTWNYYENQKITHWTYPFAVDATVYHTRSILEIIKKVAYHDPITMEAFGVEYITNKKLFKVGIGPITSKLIGTKLNRVSTSTLNPTINISPDFLNAKYIEGYELELELPQKIFKANIVPEKVFLVKENIKQLIYNLDEYGKRVQDALGIEGAKEEF
jgi:hypothetical protein